MRVLCVHTGLCSPAPRPTGLGPRRRGHGVPAAGAGLDRGARQRGAHDRDRRGRPATTWLRCARARRPAALRPRASWTRCCATPGTSATSRSRCRRPPWCARPRPAPGRGRAGPCFARPQRRCLRPAALPLTSRASSCRMRHGRPPLPGPCAVALRRDVGARAGDGLTGDAERLHALLSPSAWFWHRGAACFSVVPVSASGRRRRRCMWCGTRWTWRCRATRSPLRAAARPGPGTCAVRARL